MKIAINKKIVKGPWGGGNQILRMLVNYFQSNDIDITYSLSEDVDVILMMDVRDGSCCFPISSIRNHKAKVVHRINDTGAHRENDQKRTKLILEANSIADETIFISEWVKGFYEKNGFSKKSFVIDNAANRDLFKPSSRIRKEVEPLSIVTHHWSDNPSKGYDIYKSIDNFCKENSKLANFKFIGRECCHKHFSSSCDKIRAKPYKEIPKYLNNTDLYISASLFEAGGCHIVEGMACGLIPIVRKGGGGTEDYSEGFGFVFNDVNEIFNIIHSLHKDYSLYRKMKMKVESEYTYTSNEMCKKYLDIIRL